MIRSPIGVLWFLRLPGFWAGMGQEEWSESWGLPSSSPGTWASTVLLVFGGARDLLSFQDLHCLRLRRVENSSSGDSSALSAAAQLIALPARAHPAQQPGPRRRHTAALYSQYMYLFGILPLKFCGFFPLEADVTDKYEAPGAPSKQANVGQ